VFIDVNDRLGSERAAVLQAASRIVARRASIRVLVDGQRFTGAARLLWPQGSKQRAGHRSGAAGPRRQDAFRLHGAVGFARAACGFRDALVITADPTIAFYKATVTLQYAVSLNFFTCPSLDITWCGSPGIVFVNNTAYLVNTDVYFEAGSTITLMAVPNPGYVFTGWLQGLGNTSQAYLNSFPLARRGERITVLDTGFGPYQATFPDGFAATHADTLTDHAQLLLKAKSLSPNTPELPRGTSAWWPFVSAYRSPANGCRDRRDQSPRRWTR